MNFKDPADYWDDYCEMQHNEERRKEKLEDDYEYILDMFYFELEERIE